MSNIDLNIEVEKRIRLINDLTNNSETFPISKIENLIFECLKTFKNGGKLAFVGNGGSAAEAIHLAAEFTGKCVVNHDPLPAICLNESQSALTAIGNDYGFEFIFSRLVKSNLKNGDILIALSTSGTSKNIIQACSAANEIGVKTYLWTGAKTANIKNVIQFNVPSTSTPRIQEIHLAWGHIFSEIVELHYKTN